MKRVSVLVVMVGVLVAAATAAQAVTLRYQGKADEVRRYSLAMAQRMQMEMDGQKNQMEGTMTALVARKITSVEDGVFTVEQKTTKGKATAKDSSTDKPSQEDLPDASIVMRFDALGRIKQYQPDEEAVMSDPTAELAQALLETGVFPDRDLKVGDTWSGDKEIKDENVGTVKVHFVRKLVALEAHEGRDCAKIETKFEGSIELPPDMMGAGDVPGMELSASHNFSGTEVTWFDHQAGLVVSEETNMKTLQEMHMTMPAVGAGEDVEHVSKIALIANTKVVLHK
jgi:hypothetical protein